MPIIFDDIAISAVVLAHGIKYIANKIRHNRESKIYTNYHTTSALKKTEKGVAILGMKNAGKTTMWNNIRNISIAKPDETSYDKIDSFTYKKKDGSEIIIKPGYDIGGGDFYKTNYPSLIDKADIVFYLFDINRWNNEEERREIKSRLQFITEKCIEKNKNLCTLLTHSDEINNNDIITKSLLNFKEEICKSDDGSYKQAVLTFKYFPIDTTKKESVKEIFEKYL